MPGVLGIVPGHFAAAAGALRAQSSEETLRGRTPGHSRPRPLNKAGLRYCCRYPSGIRIRGALDVGRLARAAERTAADMYTLAGRFEHGSGRDTFVLDPSRRRMSHAFVELTDAPGDLMKSGLGEISRRAVSQSRDLQDDPLAHVLTARLAADDHWRAGRSTSPYRYLGAPPGC